MPVPKGQRERLIAAGELVANAPYRERMQWLREHDLEPSMSLVCERLVAQGFDSFGKGSRNQHGDAHVDTSFLQRMLGIRRQAASRTRDRQRHLGQYTEWIARDLAQALYVALEMDPLWEVGERAPVSVPRRHDSRFCGWGGGCVQQPGHGRFGRFCQEHAKVMAGIRETGFTKTGAVKRSGRRFNPRPAADDVAALLEESAA